MNLTDTQNICSVQNVGFAELSRWFTNFKDGSRPGQPKTVVTNAYIAAVAGMNKRDARLTMKSIAHSVCISSGSAHKNLTRL